MVKLYLKEIARMIKEMDSEFLTKRKFHMKENGKMIYMKEKECLSIKMEINILGYLKMDCLRDKEFQNIRMVIDMKGNLIKAEEMGMVQFIIQMEMYLQDIFIMVISVCIMEVLLH